MDMIQILIVDDQMLFAENLKIMLETLTEDMRVIGIASDGLQAVEMAEDLKPDIILMDIRMPKMNGVDATKAILSKNKNQKIVIMTTFQEEEYVTATLNYGAIGYLLKNMKSGDLIIALRAAVSGSVLISPEVVSQLLKDASDDMNEEEVERSRSLYDSFSNREKEVLRMMAAGYSNRRIAQELFLSEPTVRNYISAIYTKLGTNDRMEVIASAKRLLSYLPRN